MPEYKKNAERNHMRKYELPSTPGAEVFLPNKLGYGSRIRIRSEGYKVHVAPGPDGTDQIFQTFDPAATERELLVQALTDERTYHNLTLNGRPIKFSRQWIDDEMDEGDALYLGAVLMNDMGEEVGLENENEGESQPVTDQSIPSPENSSQLLEFPNVDGEKSNEKNNSEPTSTDET